MIGTVRTISMGRRVIIDLMRASIVVPFVTVRKILSLRRLAAARQDLINRPAWVAIFAKGFAILAKEQPVLRTAYLKWPWPRFFEFQQTVAMIVVAPGGMTDGVLLFPIKAPDLVSLAEADVRIRKAKTQPIEETPFFRKIMRVTRLPLPVRRLVWALGLNIGRWRGNFFGNLVITSVAAFGGGELEGLSPTSFILSYDRLSDDGSINVMIRWDHRITEAAVIGAVLSRLEQVLNDQIADELLALASAGQNGATPTLTDRPVFPRIVLTDHQ
jgi:hypothetical protein